MKEEYEALLIDFPAEGENPFEYKEDDAEYFLWLSNRTKCCGKLSKRFIDVKELMSPDIPPELTGGYTNLELYKRKFVLFMGEQSYGDIFSKHLKDELLYCDKNLSEDDLAADNLMFVYCKKGENIRTTTAAWGWHPKLIKELTGKEKYSISDARKIINSMRNGDVSIYACIGAELVWTQYWH